jgi:hypothetical protein
MESKMPVKIAAFLAVTVLVAFLAAPGIAYRAHEIVTVEADGCQLLVEFDEDSGTLRLRVRPEGRNCRIEKTSMIAALKAAFAQTDPPKLSALYIGRLIDYPWLSQHLATTASGDPAWDKRRGKPTSLDINRYVADLLSRAEITGQIQEAFATTGYRVVGATVEKVLVGGFHDVPGYAGKSSSGKIPYDAMVWFRLERQ